MRKLTEAEESALLIEVIKLGPFATSSQPKERDQLYIAVWRASIKGVRQQSIAAALNRGTETIRSWTLAGEDEYANQMAARTNAILAAIKAGKIPAPRICA